MTVTKPQTLIDEVHRRIGRNLLRFQEIEVALKFLLPYIHPDGGAKGIDALNAYRQDQVQSKTLGPLFEQLKSSIDASPGFFDVSLENLLTARNNLVHHFHELPEVDLLKPDGAEQAIAYLDRQFRDAEEWAKIIRTQSLMVLLILMISSPTMAADYGQYFEKLMQQLPTGIEYIDQIDPTRTLWPSTRIVQLLQRAESETEQVNGMTSLANAGRFIRQQSPDVSKEEYGFKTLKQILIASGLFTMKVGQDGTTVLYKSLPKLTGATTAPTGDALSWTLVRQAQ